MLEALIFAGVSTLLYHLGMGFLFFLVPVQVVGVRRGRRSFLVTSTFCMVSRVVGCVGPERREEEAQLELTASQAASRWWGWHCTRAV